MIEARFSEIIPSPVGELLLLSDGDGLTGVYPDSHKKFRRPTGTKSTNRCLTEAREQIAAYFAGALTTFDLSLGWRGTPFQLRVWEALRSIPYGQTVSYGELAARLGDAKWSRAVGAANGRNPISLIVPCHRVIGSGGALVGYAGGLPLKQWLLNHEAAGRTK